MLQMQQNRAVALYSNMLSRLILNVAELKIKLQSFHLYKCDFKLMNILNLPFVQ